MSCQHLFGKVWLQDPLCMIPCQINQISLSPGSFFSFEAGQLQGL